MINFTLYKREMKSLWKLLLIFVAIVTLYVSIIISMFDPALSKTLDEFAKAMPEMMAAVGMSGDTSTLLAFMTTYLYGFILLVFPMIFSIICGYRLIARYIERGNMVSLLAAPIKKHKIVLTQMSVMQTCIVVLLVYTTILQIVVASFYFPDQLEVSKLLLLNLGLFCLQLFIASVCFFCSSVLNDAKYSLGLGVGIPALSYVLNMLANSGEKAEWLKYFTFFTLFDPKGIIALNHSDLWGCFALLLGALILFASSVFIFSKKDLPI